MIVNQWIPAAHDGDALGNSARRMRGLLRTMGHQAEVYSLTIDTSLEGDVRRFSDPGSRQGDITILHYALPSPMTEALANVKGLRILQYHNVTPASFFAPYDAALFRLAVLARQELKTLAGRVDLALGVSDFNRQELESLGFAETGVLPLAVDLSRITRPVSLPALEQTLDDEFVNFLFVGRIAPNKKIEDHIRLEMFLKRVKPFAQDVFDCVIENRHSLKCSATVARPSIERGTLVSVPSPHLHLPNHRCLRRRGQFFPLHHCPRHLGCVLRRRDPVNRLLRERKLNAAFIKDLFDATIEFAANTPLLDRPGFQTGTHHHGGIIKPLKSQDFQRLKHVLPVGRILAHPFVNFTQHGDHCVDVLTV